MKQAFMRSIKQLKRVDLFGAQIKFNIDGKSTYQSSLGGLMTIAMVIAIGIIFISEIINFFAKVNINAQVYQNFSRSPQQITLDQDNMLFAIGIEQLGLPAFNERPFYNITMTQRIHNQTTGSKQYRDIPLIPCTMERFKNFTAVDQQTMEHIFTQSNFHRYLCPPLNFNLSMKGAFLDVDFQFVKIQVTPCKNNSNNSYWNPVQFHLNQICASPQTIQNYLFKNNFLRFNLYATNYVINAEKNLNITQMYMSEDLRLLFQPNISNKIVNVYFRNYKVDTDDSLYIRSHNITNYVYRGESSFTIQNIQNLGHVYKNELTEEQEQNLNLLSSVTLNLRADYFNTQAQRKFQKVDSLLSYFGGIFQTFFLGFGLLMAYYNHSYFRLYLSNKLYDFKETKEQQPQKTTQLQIFSNEDLQDLKQTGGPDPKYELDVKLSDVTNEVKMKELGFKNRSEFLIWYFEKILSKKKKLKLTANYFIYVLSCGKYYSDNRNKLVDVAFKKVEIDLNIKHLLNQVLQLDKLKKLVLTNQQVTLFDFFPKKLITLQGKVSFDTNTVRHNRSIRNKTLSTQIQTNVDYESFKKLLNAFEIISTSETTDETTQQINKKLVFLLGTELRSVFNASLLIEKQDQDSKDNQNINYHKSSNDKGDNINIIDETPMSCNNREQIQNNSLLVQQNRVEDAHLHNLISKFMINVADSNIQAQLDQGPQKIPIDDSPYLIVK